MKKNNLFNTNEIVQDLKKVIADKKKIERNTVSREVMYQRMVEEAVMVIHTCWKDDAEFNALTSQDTFEVNAYHAFSVSEELSLYSEKGNYKRNPETDKCCFFDVYTFLSEDEKEQYIVDVLAQLPLGTTYEMQRIKMPWNEVYEVYNFKLKFTVE